jgi:hypothetical protein
MSPALQIPLSIQWVAGALALVAIGTLSRPLQLVGGAGVIVSLGCAIVAAARARLERTRGVFFTRLILAGLCALGPLVRSVARERVRFRLEHRPPGSSEPAQALEMRGGLTMAPDRVEGAPPAAAKPLLDALRAALVREGLAAAPGDDFQNWDLQILLPPAIRVPLNAVDEGGGRVSLRWRLDLDRRAVAIAAGVVVVLLMVAGASWLGGLIVFGFAAAAFVMIAASRAAVIPAAIRRSAAEVAGSFGLRVISAEKEPPR